MLIPLVIGRNSSGEPYVIDLSLLPNLFISFYEEEQLLEMLTGMLNEIASYHYNEFSNSGNSIKLALSFSRRLSEKLIPLDGLAVDIAFIHSDDGSNTIRTIDDFITELSMLLKKRKALQKATYAGIH